MCMPATCKQCGKRTWRGCGQHVDQVMAGVPRSEHCTCSRQTGPGLAGALRTFFARKYT